MSNRQFSTEAKATKDECNVAKNGPELIPKDKTRLHVPGYVGILGSPVHDNPLLLMEICLQLLTSSQSVFQILKRYCYIPRFESLTS